MNPELHWGSRVIILPAVHTRHLCVFSPYSRVSTVLRTEVNRKFPHIAECSEMGSVSKWFGEKGVGSGVVNLPQYVGWVWVMASGQLS